MQLAFMEDLKTAAQTALKTTKPAKDSTSPTAAILGRDSTTTSMVLRLPA